MRGQKTVKVPFAVGSSMQSSNKNSGQNFLIDPGRSCDYSAYRSDHPLLYSGPTVYNAIVYSVSHKLLNNLYCIDDEVRLLQPQISYCNHKTGLRAKKH